jgi:hypothetical protein
MRRFHRVIHARVGDGHETAMLALRPRFVEGLKHALPGLLGTPLLRLYAAVVGIGQREAVDHPIAVA